MMAKQPTVPDTVQELPSYNEVLAYLEQQKRQKHLLLGNGFSMAYDKKIFSYNALSKFIEKTGDDIVNQLFQKFNTKNFESIMQQLDNFCSIAELFSDDPKLVPRIKRTSDSLKLSLLDAVKSLHPEHVFTMTEEQSQSCMHFLEQYLNHEGQVFSTNYDLLLYWVLMRNKADNAIDGFGRDLEKDLDGQEYTDLQDDDFSELRWGKRKGSMTVFHMHGTLPIFDTGIHIVKVEYDSQHYLLENVKQRIEDKQYPVFVTAGNGQEKLVHIMHNKYLSYCYEALCTIQGSLVVFGFGFGESDTHIIDAINKAAKQKRGAHLLSVYIGVYSDEGLKRMAALRSHFKCKVNLYNARTANIWQT